MASGDTKYNDEKSAEQALDDLLSQDEPQEAPPPYDHDALIAGLFPPRWNLYHHHTGLTSSDFRIGTHKDQTYFNVNLGRSWFISTLTITQLSSPLVPDNLTQSNEPLAKIQGESAMSRQANAAISSTGYEGKLAYHWSLTTSTYSFIVPVPDGNGGEYPQKFEWRHSRGQEVKSIGKTIYGWKLVRLETVSPPVAESSRSSRSMGSSSDGKEVVAVYGQNMSLSLKKYGRFQFLGSGLTGELGKTWAIMTVASICRIFQIQLEDD